MKSIIDNQHLRIYVTLARLLNMSRAAEELQLTPSAISHALKALEKDLGYRLFERTSRKMTLSRLGAEFLVESEDILERMRLLRNRIHANAHPTTAQLRIGASTTACQYILPHTLSEFREDFPDATVQIEPCTGRQALAFLAEDRIDLALVIDGTHPTSLEFTFLAEDDLQFLLHPDHAWAADGKVRRDMSEDPKLIMPERSSESYAMVETYFRKEGITIKPFVEIANEDAIKNFVQKNLGVGILPRWMAAKELEKKELVALPLGRRKLTRRWGILRTKARPPTFAEAFFISKCREILGDLMLPTATALSR